MARDAAGRPQHLVVAIEAAAADQRAPAGAAAPSGPAASADEAAPLEPDHARAIVSAIPEGYALTIDTEIRAVNEALCTLTGFAPEELIGARPPYPFWPPELAGVNEELRRTISDQQGGAFELTLMRADGEHFEAVITAAAARDAAGNPIGFVNTVRDVSADRRQRRELERLARTDSLTGLANRHVLHESLTREAGRRSGENGRLALVLLDIDCFKQVNDAHGHPTGDAVLAEVARRLECTIRAHEVLARAGGEEFALVLPGCTREEAVAAADRAREAIASRPFAGVGTLTMSAGVGAVDTPADPETIYRIADRALYEAKQSGRDRTCSRSTIAGDGHLAGV